MHQERVERHSKGIASTLSEFKNRFQCMVEEHNEEVTTQELKIITKYNLSKIV